MGKGIMRYTSLLCCLFLFASIGGVLAVWYYVEGNMEIQQEELSVNMSGFIYMPEEMPDEEVTLIERLYAILNRKYQTEKVIDSRDYLINQTIQVYWEPGAPPYVGSMDNNLPNK